MESPLPLCSYVLQLHLFIIVIPFSLLRLVLSPFLGLSVPFPFCLPHALKVFLIFVVQSFPPRPYIPYLFYNHLYIVKGDLTQHQLSCIVHRRLICLKESVALDFAMFSSLFNMDMDASINIIDVFHLGLLCPCSYHHIPYVLQVNIQRTLHIHLFRLTYDLSNVVT